MNKLLTASLIIISTMSVSEKSISGTTDDQIKATLLDHVQATTLLDFRGTTKVAFLDSIIQSINYDDSYLLNGQLGLTQHTTKNNDINGGNFIAGIYLRIDPFINQYIHYPEHWRFLNSLEHGVGWHYDFRDRENYFNYQFGLAFQLNPKE